MTALSGVDDMVTAQNETSFSRSVLMESWPVELEGLWHRYGGADEAWILKDINLQLKTGELVGLLGPSGCGKTTLLRLIAGFEHPSQGVVRLHGNDVASSRLRLAPERRGVGMVFQDYALFPHLNAWENTCFGLRRGQDTSRASWLLELLGLTDLKRRYPHELSGGQRQRLALARALAPAPSVLLLDEPFSNLDVEVRLRLRSELPGVLSACGASGLLVTHDPEEALAICGRVAILRDGQLHQCATPRELAEVPATPFVGRFVLQRNVLPVWRDGSTSLCRCLLGDLEIPEGQRSMALPDDATVLVDPALIDLAPDPAGDAYVMGREFLGRFWLYRIQIGDQQLRLIRPLAEDHQRGLRCKLSLQQNSEVLLHPQCLSLQVSN